MNLPNYFLADLPPEASLTSAIVQQACEALRKNRERYLAPRSTDSIIRTLCDLGSAWLQEDFPFRRRVLEEGPELMGFSSPTLATGLDAFFETLTVDQFHALLVQEFGDRRTLDEFVEASVEVDREKSSWARGPELLGHVCPGNVPTPTLHSIVLGLLIRSAQFVKCASGSAFLARMFGHSLYEADPKLASCLELAEWPGGTPGLDHALFSEVDCLTATGSDETLAQIRHRLPAGTPLIGYGTRVSFAYIARDALAEGRALRALCRGVALDLAMWDQRGCLSPHVVYVETGSAVSPDQFAENLAEELARHELVAPRAALPVEGAAEIAAKRSFYEVRAAASIDTRLWSSAGTSAWTVVFEADPLFQISCANRFIYVKATSDLGEVLRASDSIRGAVSTVGLAASPSSTRKMSAELAAWGVSRICPIGRMQQPRLTWRHDGRPVLGELVKWTEVESA